MTSPFSRVCQQILLAGGAGFHILISYPPKLGETNTPGTKHKHKQHIFTDTMRFFTLLAFLGGLVANTCALIAMAAAATANASVSDAVLANAMAFAKDARRVIDANNGRRQLAEEADHMKGKCVKGQATDIASMKSAGIDLFIPTTGYCMNGDPTSLLLTCDGTIFVVFFNPPQFLFS
jgi:hypothetical protein